MQKTILIFGGGENQLTLIKATKPLGVTSVVVDPNPEAPGKEFADHFEVVGPSDYELTKKIALKYKVDGIVTSQMENPLRIMARLAHELDLIFPSPEVIEQCRNKYLMKQAFLQHGIPCARGILLKEGEKIIPDILENLDFPLIIKPSDSYSSRGVYRIESFEELLQHENDSRCFSSDKSVIVEEFIEGPEYSIESLTFKGNTSIIQYTEKIITPYPHTVELGHIEPADLNEEQKEEIDFVVINAIKALGIDNSATHTELKLSRNGPVIIEIGARLGGDYISSYLTVVSTGVNMDKAAIKIALGEAPDIDINNKSFIYIKYLELPEGRIVNQIGNWEELLENEEIVHARITVKKGDIIPKISDSAKRPGFIIIKGNSKKDVQTKANIIYNQFLNYIILN
jgi:biotin carboxylase